MHVFCATTDASSPIRSPEMGFRCLEYASPLNLSCVGLLLGPHRLCVPIPESSPSSYTATEFATKEDSLGHPVGYLSSRVVISPGRFGVCGNQRQGLCWAGGLFLVA
ncbi:hypothetical protein VTN02DRAFT_3289 [Thermoascus thermophilus]